MKILVLSDSHSSLRFMNRGVEKLKPDAIVHLGDYYDDGETIAEAWPNIPLHQVAGNCDKYRAPISAREFLCYPVGGVMLCMTHGHNHHVKQGLYSLLADARRNEASAVLYGHTHIPDCHQEEDGLWVLNPGSAGYGCGIVETDGSKVTACYLLTEKDLEDMVLF